MEIYVRHVEPEDYEAFHRIFSGPKAMSGTLQIPLPSKAEWREKLANPPEGLFSLVACEGNGEVFGSIGMAVRDDWRGKGVGSRLVEGALDLADNWLNLTRVELTVFVDNEAGIALYEKFGFEIECTHRRCALRNGEYVDAYSMARLKNKAPA